MIKLSPYLAEYIGTLFFLFVIIFTGQALPIGLALIIAGVDRLLDMFRTSINVAGDLTIASIVNKFINN